MLFFCVTKSKYLGLVSMWLLLSLQSYLWSCRESKRQQHSWWCLSSTEQNTGWFLLSLTQKGLCWLQWNNTFSSKSCLLTLLSMSSEHNIAAIVVDPTGWSNDDLYLCFPLLCWIFEIYPREVLTWETLLYPMDRCSS